MMTRAFHVGIVAVPLAVLLTSTVAEAQGAFGIGPRITFIRGGDGSPDGSQRFSGGFIRLGAGKAALELAMDYRSGLTGDLTEQVKDYPIQASLLLFPVRSSIAPYVLAGVGWYTQNVERLSSGGALVDQETTRKMGYHGGFGAELRVHRHVGLHGDYRYTFIRFGDDESTATPARSPLLPSWLPFSERLKASHEGSMFTWGATFYF
jgi:hypothetical protein